MKKGKWIGMVIGWVVSGPLGAMVGLAIGTVLDNVSDEEGNPRQQAAQDEQGGRSGFLFSLLVLAAYIIRSDGKVMHSEMEVVRRFLRQNFGEEAVAEGEQILYRLFEEQKRQSHVAFSATVSRCCAQMAAHMDHPMRLQLLNFLVIIAQADGRVPSEELGALSDCARWMGLSRSDLDSMLHLRGDSLEEAYKVLGVAPTATDDEIRRAYRKLALEHHPDRVASLGPDIRQAAENKMQEINAARDKVFKARGM